MLPTVKPALDPLAQRAAINALEAQRAAYQRYARTVEDQSRAVSGGDADRAVSASDVAARGADELEAGARALRPHLDRVRDQGSPDQQADVQRRLETLASDAERAQGAIQNLTAQLDAWRVAYGRQLASVGLPPGGIGQGGDGLEVGTAGSGGGAGPAEPIRLDGPAGDGRAGDRRAYGPRGHVTTGGTAPTLLNRLG
jgi:hypothetical protein